MIFCNEPTYNMLAVNLITGATREVASGLDESETHGFVRMWTLNDHPDELCYSVRQRP